jgi:carbohydrate-binding DOMON domain-containing protein
MIIWSVIIGGGGGGAGAGGGEAEAAPRVFDLAVPESKGKGTLRQQL